MKATGDLSYRIIGMLKPDQAIFLTGSLAPFRSYPLHSPGFQANQQT